MPPKMPGAFQWEQSEEPGACTAEASGCPLAAWDDVIALFE